MKTLDQTVQSFVNANNYPQYEEIEHKPYIPKHTSENSFYENNTPTEYKSPQDYFTIKIPKVGRKMKPNEDPEFDLIKEMKIKLMDEFRMLPRRIHLREERINYF